MSGPSEVRAFTSAELFSTEDGVACGVGRRVVGWTESDWHTCNDICELRTALVGFRSSKYRRWDRRGLPRRAGHPR